MHAVREQAAGPDSRRAVHAARAWLDQPQSSIEGSAGGLDKVSSLARDGLALCDAHNHSGGLSGDEAVDVAAEVTAVTAEVEEMRQGVCECECQGGGVLVGSTAGCDSPPSPPPTPPTPTPTHTNDTQCAALCCALLPNW